MAVTASGLFIATFRDVLDTTQLAIDLDLETHKIALFDDTITPNFSTDTAYAVAPYDAGEEDGTGYTAGGAALTGTTFTEAITGSLVFDADDSSWTTSTFTDVIAGLIYADVLAGNNAIALIDFETAASTVAGTFLVTWTAAASGGVWAWDLTP